MISGVVHTARLVQEELMDLEVQFRAAFITLTYRPGIEWAPEHVKELLRHYRRWCQRHRCEFRYVWVMELTKAGVPHYHIVAWLPRGITPPLPDKQGWWAHGMTQAKWARSPVGYLAKYASKGLDGSQALPRGARLWGCGGVSKDVRAKRSYFLAPGWARSVSEPCGEIKKLAGGWWAILSTGFRVRTPWQVDFGAGVLRWRGWTSWDVEFFGDASLYKPIPEEKPSESYRPVNRTARHPEKRQVGERPV